MRSDVIIIGAGAAGLIAARELSVAGKSVVVLEARDRIGGRIFQLSEEEFGYPAQGGAEFVHGKAPITHALVEEARLHLNHLTEWWSVRDDELKPGPVEIPHERELIEKLKGLHQDLPVADFLKENFVSETYAGLRDAVLRIIGGYWAGDIRRASSFALRDELTDEEEWQQKSIKEGYGALIEFLKEEIEKAGSRVLLNKEVKAIDFSKEIIEVLCADGTRYTASKILTTTPLALLQRIDFNPHIPEKIKAASEIGYGPALKILMRFRTKWWAGAREQKFENLFFMFSDEEIPTWWTQAPEPRLTLTGWAAGPRAEQLSALSESELVEKGLFSLSNIFKIPLEDLKKQLIVAQVVSWANDSFARGAYSYETPETPEAVKELLSPIENRIFFASEALGGEEAEIGTVEAAFVSGVKASRQIAKS